MSFPPESGGRVKPRRAMEEMRTHGTIRLLFSLPRVRFSPESGGRVEPRRAMDKRGHMELSGCHLAYIE